jgi:hypothetical protein
MKLHLYTNNAYDTVALVNDDNKVVSHWGVDSALGVALKDALYTTDVSEWGDNGYEIDVNDFAVGNELYLVIEEDGEWEVVDRYLLRTRLSFHLGDLHPIVQALNA